MADSLPLTADLTTNADVDVGTWIGGEGVIGVEGTWGGGTLQFKSKKPGGSTARDWGSDGQLTDDGMIAFTLPRDHIIVASLSGATSPDLDVDVSQAAARR